MTTNHVNVLIVDDSAVVRQVLGAVLEQDPAIKVIGSAPDPIYAMQRMNRNWPDVVVLDVEMPRMDGITFLKELHGGAADTGRHLFHTYRARRPDHA